ncbi:MULTISPECIES: sarcosine oxidase subunit delta [Streptomyces]|uniref:Sarcosine oxidase subunit delta n=1 Tax=Streptomyces ramulosus TaxID=47762 RepID=A0ABW1FBP9_9ACTN
MLQLTCPWCGPRDETEFRHGGQAHVARPADPAALDDEAWAAYLFFRDNPAGPFAERWVHSLGCRRWFHAVRDTVTYAVLATYRPDQPRPDVAAAPRPDGETR